MRDIIHTDQCKNFDSGLIKEICKLLGIKKTRTTSYHPESDGLVEPFNRTLLKILSMSISDNESDWDLQLPTLLMAYRTSVHETSGETPDPSYGLVSMTSGETPDPSYGL